MVNLPTCHRILQTNPTCHQVFITDAMMHWNCQEINGQYECHQQSKHLIPLKRNKHNKLFRGLKLNSMTR